MDRLVTIVFSSLIRNGRLQVTTAAGSVFVFGDGEGEPVAVRFLTRAAERAVLLNPELRLGEAYMDGTFVVERGSIADFLDLVVRNSSRSAPSKWRRWVANVRRALYGARTITSPRSRNNAKHHYDLEASFYSLFLDQDMQYSCAYFETPDQPLDSAQLAKKRLIAKKLQIRPDDRILDIGCGWGGLALYLAEAYGAHVTGITLSANQLSAAIARAADQGLAERVQFRLEDYRAVCGTYDRIVSVGMFEHVGKRSYREFFQKCFDRLATNGLFLLHTIVRLDGPWPTNSWVARNIFPGGYTPALSEIVPHLEKCGFILCDIEVLRTHYATTLRHWRDRFLSNRDQAERIYGDRFCRKWEFYLAGFEPYFRYDGLAVLQLQLAKKLDTAPITRDYLWKGNAP